VLADLDILATLPARELACGYAEIIKYGLLGDFAFFEWLEANVQAVLERDTSALVRAVGRSVEMKAEIVAEDEKEAGRRALLNLGHTFGHAVEGEMGFGDALKHGEAVGLGMAQAFRFSVRQGLCPAQDAVRAEAAIKAAGLPTAAVRHPPRAVQRRRPDRPQRPGQEGRRRAADLHPGPRHRRRLRGQGRRPRALRAFLIEEGAV
jgi:3-dehydroquinate synthase